MYDVSEMVAALKRPKTLVAAAQIGLRDYSPSKRLRRLLSQPAKAGSKDLVLQLMDLEALANRQRREKDASYNLVRHVDILIALLFEATRGGLIRDTKKPAGF